MAALQFRRDDDKMGVVKSTSRRHTLIAREPPLLPHDEARAKT